MTTPTKPKKNPRNQPVKFDETLGGALSPSALPQMAPVAPSLSPGQIGVAVWVIFLAAAICGGIGSLIVSARRAATVAEPAVPVATGTVTAATPINYSITPTAQIPVLAAPTVEIGTSVSQADTRLLTSTLSDATFQPASPADGLQPGFTSYGSVQGTTGIAPALK